MSDYCPTCNVPLTDHGGIAVTCAEVQRLRELCRKQQSEIEDLTGFADAVDVLHDIGKLIGCDHVDSPDERRQLVNCVEHELDAKVYAEPPQWLNWDQVSREVWDGDIWWHDNGDQIYPVNIAWCPTGEYFFATLGQWGWSRSQPLKEMGGKWMPCREPEPDAAYRDLCRFGE